MERNRKIGITVGTLFIVGTVAGISSFFFTGEPSNSNEYLVKIASDSKPFIIGSLFILLMGFALAFIPVVVYPILKEYNKTLALGYVLFRGAIETATYIATWVSMLLVLFVSKTYALSNTSDREQLRNAVATILDLRQLSSVSTIFVFAIGALLFYTALYQSKLVPNWLSLWGIIAIIFYLITAFLTLFESQTESSSLNSYLSFPIFLQEMVMAIWLIMKGFDSKNNKLKTGDK